MTTVEQLIEQLRIFPPDAVIVLLDEYEDEFSIDSVYIAHNQLVIKIEGSNDERTRTDDSDEDES